MVDIDLAGNIIQLCGPSKARFETIFTEGKRVSGDFLKVIAIQGSGLIGIATSRALGNRPKRNRIRRQIQAALRLESSLTSSELDIVIQAGKKTSEHSFDTIRSEMATLLERMNERWANQSESS